MTGILFCLSVGFIGILIVIFGFRNMIRLPSHLAIENIGLLIRKGSMTYLKKQYQALVPLVFLLSIASYFLFSYSFPIFFLLGSFFSILCGYFGMNISTISNFKTTQGAEESLSKALSIAFYGGSSMGIACGSLGIIGVAVSIWTGTFLMKVPVQEILLPYTLGATIVSLFARIGGGIFTKAADIGADLVGKLEARIPEDDARNPAVIADNVGDNVGDIAGMGADLFGSYNGVIFGSLALIAALIKDQFNLYLNFVLLLLSISFFSTLLVVIIHRLWMNHKNLTPEKILNRFRIYSALLCILSVYFLTTYLHFSLSLFLVLVSGIVCSFFLGIITIYYTSKTPVRTIAKNSMLGAAPNILTGLSFGLESTAITVLILAVTLWFDYYLIGSLGIAFGGLGILLTITSTITLDAFGPIADNAGGIAEMAHLPPEVRERTDILDSIGNSTAAIGKSFAIGSAFFATLALFSAFMSLNFVTHILKEVSLSSTPLLFGLLLGSMIPYMFSASTINAVNRTANMMVKEVRYQLKTVVGLLEGTCPPNYEKCIEISTIGALKGTFLPSLMGIVPPFILFWTGGIEAVCGLIIGSFLSGIMLAIFMSNAGGAWDNAKKLIETGKMGGKGSLAHMSSIIGDTVGDPLKDTSGPSLNILIKLLTIVSLTFIPLLVP